MTTPPSRMAQDAAIAAALRAGQKRWDVATTLGVPYERVCKLARKHNIPNSGWRTKPGNNPEKAREAVEMYLAHGTMEKAGKALGVSRAWVERLIVQHEENTGQPVPRFPPPTKPRSDAFCGRCGRLIGRMTTQVAKNHSGYCRACAAFRSAHGIPDEQIEEWIAAVKGGARWLHLTTAKGWAKNESHRIPLAVYTRLYRDGRLAEIMQLWPQGVPAYILKRVHARKVPTVWIPHEGKVS